MTSTPPRNMASDNGSSRVELYESGLTVPSDSENYSANHEISSSPPSTSSSPLILYKPPTLWSILRGAAINLVLPFVNGLMLGLGELLAHEAAFRLGWSGTKVRLVRSAIPSTTVVAGVPACAPGFAPALLIPFSRFSLLIDVQDHLVRESQREISRRREDALMLWAFRTRRL